MHPNAIREAADRIRMEYGEMPGLQLTFWQVQRLWNLSEEQCDRALGMLTASGFLVRAADGLYKLAHTERMHVSSTASEPRFMCRSGGRLMQVGATRR